MQVLPSESLIPKNFGLESLPFLVVPAAFLCAISVNVDYLL